MRVLATLAIILALAGVARAGSDFDSATNYPMNELLPTESAHSTAYESAHQIATGPGLIGNLTVDFHTAAYRTIMLFDSATTVAPGTVSPDWCFEGLAQSTDPAESVKAVSFFGQPFRFHKGLYVAASTSTAGCTTLTLDAGNAEWFIWQFIGAAR